jgi:hypothetical protein
MFNFFHKISYKQTCKKIGDNSIVEPTIIEKLKSTASYLLILGVGLQIFVYIFLV